MHPRGYLLGPAGWRVPIDRQEGEAVADEPEPHPRDGMRIHLDNPEDVAYWMERLDCSAGELGDAVRAVGAVGDRVESWLRGRRPPANDPQS
jgi:hypothetical protein